MPTFTFCLSCQLGLTLEWYFAALPLYIDLCQPALFRKHIQLNSNLFNSNLVLSNELNLIDIYKSLLIFNKWQRKNCYEIL